METENLRIGDLVFKHRKLVGFSQKKLAEDTGYAEVTIRQIEKKKFDPSPMGLHKIAQALDVTVIDLLPDGIRDEDDLTAASIEESLLRDNIIEDSLALSDAEKDGNADGIRKLEEKIFDSRLKRERLIRAMNEFQNKYSISFDSPLEYELDHIAKGLQSSDNYFGRKAKIITAFDKLNEDGQNAAVERIEELTEIPKYQKESI